MSKTAVDIVIRVLVALLLGGLVGLEREFTDHPAGVRTHMLVAMGSCIFTAMSLYGFTAFPGGDRVAAGVVAGIGFIGAGAILKSEKGVVTGLTTAASLWSCAAIGMVVGTGFFLVSVILTAADLLVLEIVDRLADRIAPLVKARNVPLTLRGDFRDESLAEVRDLLRDRGCRPELLRFCRLGDGRLIDLTFLVRTSPRVGLEEMTRDLYEARGISEILWG